MKKSLFIIILALLATTAIKAQDAEDNRRLSAIHPGMKYRQLKQIYSPFDYEHFSFTEEPRYNLKKMTAAAVCMPGLGHLIEGEILGIGYLVPWASGIVLTTMGGYYLSDILSTKGNNSIFSIVLKPFTVYLLIFELVIGSAMFVTSEIMSIVDTVKMTKVKNMYYDDLNKITSMPKFDVKFTPYIDMLAMNCNKLTPVAGLSLKLAF